MYTIYHYFVLSSIAIVVLCNAYNTGIRHGTPQSRDSLPDKRLVGSLCVCVSLAQPMGQCQSWPFISGFPSF